MIMKIAIIQSSKCGKTPMIYPVLLLLVTVISQARSYLRTPIQQCERIKDPLCQGYYNYTKMPNILGHDDHEEASVRLAEFAPLIDNTCSRHVKFFLCSLHFPMCVKEIPVGIPACREMCEEVRVNCEMYLRVFHFEWPETIQCNKLPSAASRQCLSPPIGIPQQRGNIDARPVSESKLNFQGEKETDLGENPGSSAISRKERRTHHNSRQNKRKKEKNGKKSFPESPQSSKNIEDDPETEIVQNPEKKEEITSSKSKWSSPVTPVSVASPVTNSAPNYHRWSPFKPGKGLPLYPSYGNSYLPVDGSRDNRLDSPRATPPKCKNSDKFYFVERAKKCLPICDAAVDVMFSSSDKTFVYYWMMVCSILCLISSALTFGTYLVDSKRFRYPERPIIFLSLCYLLYSTAYLVRLGRGPGGSVSCVTEDGSDIKHLVMGELESTGCTAVFFLLYYFGMAAAVWWVNLSITWFLAAGLKWGHEAIEANGFCFHLAAWVLPAVQTIVILVMGKVDGDELTGLCYVGNLDKDSLLYFIIIPLSIYLAVGTLALGCGFLSLLKIRRVMKKTGDNPIRLEKLILKIGIFTVLYIVPTSCVVAVNVYQYNNFDLWMEKAETRPCSRASTNPIYNAGSPDYPDYFDTVVPRYQYDYAFRTQMTYNQNFGYQDYEDQQYDNSYISGYNEPKMRRHTRNIDDAANGSRKRRQRPFHSKHYYYNFQAVRNPQYWDYQRKRQPDNPGGQYSSSINRQNVAQTSNNYMDEDSDLDCHLEESIALFPIFASKILMSLLAGITSGIWVWSGKTYKSWKIFCTTPWCGTSYSEKGSDLTANTPPAASSGNLNIAPSVTSQLLPKVSRPSPDGDSYPAKRISSSVPSADNYRGYHQVKQNDDAHYVTHQKSRRSDALTLGDIAREYSDNWESQMMSPSSLMMSQSLIDDVTLKEYNKDPKKKNSKGKNSVPRDMSSTNRGKTSRAVPNAYVDHTHLHAHRFQGHIDEPYFAPVPIMGGRVRKYSESDANRLNLVSGSGFNPITTSTRKKAESAHVSRTNRI